MKIKLLILFISFNLIVFSYAKDNSDDNNLKIAFDAYMNQDDNTAFIYANKVLKVDENNVKALFIRSKVNFFRNDFKTSFKDINLALDQISKSNDKSLNDLKVQFLRDRGVIYDYQGDYEKSLKDFFEVIDLYKKYTISDFDNAMINFDVSMVYFHLKKNEDSLKYLEYAIDLNPFELSYYDSGIYLLQTLKINKNLNIYLERANVLKKYSNLISKKIIDKIFNVSNEVFNKTEGIEKFYELIFTKDGDLQDPKLFPIINLGDITEIRYFSNNFTEYKGNYMMARNDFTNKKVKIKALKIVTFYEDNSYHDLHFIYKVKLEEIKNN